MKIPTEDYRSVFDMATMLPQKSFVGPLIFDLETLPDFDRQDQFGLPEVVPYEAADPVRTIDDILGGSVDDIRDFLDSVSPTESWLHKAVEAEKSGKNRKGVHQAINRVFNRFTQAEEQEAANNKTMSTTPEMLKIVSMGYCYGTSDVHSVTVGDQLKDEEGTVDPISIREEDILEFFWSMYEKRQGPIVGYNIIGFDLPVIYARSILLGLAPPRKPLDTRPWSGDVVDVMLKRWPVRGTAGKLKELAPLYGIEVPAEGVDGGSVLPLWNEGRLDLINKYAKSDVVITRSLYEKFEGFFI